MKHNVVMFILYMFSNPKPSCAFLNHNHYSKIRSSSSRSKYTSRKFSSENERSNSGNTANSSSKKKLSSLRSLTFTQLTKRTEPALIADYLMELGASSVSITDHDEGSEQERPIFAEPCENELAAIICGDAAVGKNFWKQCDVTAHFTQSFDLRGIVDNVRTEFDLGLNPRYKVDNVPDLDWVKKVQGTWKPVLVGDFVIRFPWHTSADIQDCMKTSGVASGKSNKYKEILLEGGVAFGTGDHATTQLCLEFITNTLKGEEEGTKIGKMLDYGAGSGILGIAACKFNPEDLIAVGVEIDSDAIRIADFNADSNNVKMRSYLPRSFSGDDESSSLIIKAMRRSAVDVLPEEFDGPYFDICVANILAGPLISLTETISGMLRPGAKVGLSGILESQGGEILQAYSQYFKNIKIENEKDGWLLVTGIKK